MNTEFKGSSFPWRQGFVLFTNGTKRWSDEQMKENNEHEGRIVFSNFTEADQGRSRKRVCVCETKEDAALIAAAPNMLRLLQFIFEECTEGRLKDEIALTIKQAINPI